MRLIRSAFAALAAGLLVLCGLSPAVAQEGDVAEIVRGHLYAGTLAEGRAALEPLADGGDSAAQFGLGVVQLGQALEALVAAHNRHGFNPIDGLARSPFFSIGMPPSTAQTAEPLDYDTLRGYYAGFVDDLDAARATLIAAGEGDAFIVPFDASSIRLDLDGDGTIGKQESVGAFLGSTAQLAMGAPMGGFGPDIAAVRAPDLTFAFDNADAVWLAGYATILAAQGDFLLAHDFSEMFDAFFQRFFPRAGLPLQDEKGSGLIFDWETDLLIADLVAAVHTLDWPVVDRTRFAAVPERLVEIFALSRQNWELILAETDDDREMLPGPHQTPPKGAPAVTAEMVEAWLTTLDQAERVATGELLIPHWRFPGRGFDLAAYFDRAERTDLVMLLSGLDALPFLAEGEIAAPESFNAALSAFGGDLFGFALWFN